MNQTAAIYTRVSTDRQKKYGISLEAQVSKCQQYAAKHGFDVIYVGIEGLSAKDTDRPELQKILSLVDSKEISHFISVKLDRLARDTSDALQLAKRMTKKGVSIHLVSDGGYHDLSDPSVEAMFTMKAAFATFERRRISLNTKFALDRKKELGYKLGAARFGQSVQNGQTVENHAEMTTIKRIFELNKLGYSTRKTAQILNDTGFRPRRGNAFSQTQICRILKSA